MRTTLTIDDDVLGAVREQARREGRTAGAVLSDLVRSALSGGVTSALADVEFHGFRPLPPRGGVVTNELIDRLWEEGGE